MSAPRLAMLAGVLLAGASHLHGAERTSTDYAVTTDILDAGGRPAASANCAHEGSLGTLGSGRPARSAAYGLGHGYVGQAREVVGLTLAGNPTHIAEASHSRLHPSLVYDDATTAVIPGTMVAWTLLHGPCTLSPAGDLATEAVFQTVPAAARADYHNHAAKLDFQVINSHPDNYGLYAADGIHDDWQVRYFGPDNPFAAPGQDPDGDRQNNAFEYVADLDPTQYASQFRVSLEFSPSWPTRKNVVFGPRWPTREYAVEMAPDHPGTPFGPLLGATNQDVGSIRSVADWNATNAARFYRVRISMPPL
ncbi:MAG: hypothetical protein JXQ71_04505 [Verrucomicrobia bacterium]|nr:hypothetical protein [Verrucomicrobiota bacterium]